MYAAFIIDVYSRMVVGWQATENHDSDLALDALSMAIRQRTHTGDDFESLAHRSDSGVQYRALRHTERLAEDDLVASVGSCGNAFDDALAEAANSLFEAEMVRNGYTGPWRGIEHLEVASAESIDWFGSPASARRDRVRSTIRMRSPVPPATSPQR